MNNEPNTKKNSSTDVKICLYHEVWDGKYDCNYCGEDYECNSCECCYGFFADTLSEKELFTKLNRVVDNFMDEWDKRFFYTHSREERSCTRDDFMDMCYNLVYFSSHSLRYHEILTENRLLTLNFDELNELFHMFHEVNYDGIEQVWHRVTELYFAKCDNYDGPDPCEMEKYNSFPDDVNAEWRAF